MQAPSHTGSSQRSRTTTSRGFFGAGRADPPPVRLMNDLLMTTTLARWCDSASTYPRPRFAAPPEAAPSIPPP